MDSFHCIPVLQPIQVIDSKNRVPVLQPVNLTTDISIHRETFQYCSLDRRKIAYKMINKDGFIRILAFAFQYCSFAFQCCSLAFQYCIPAFRYCNLAFQYCSKIKCYVPVLQPSVLVLQPSRAVFQYCNRNNALMAFFLKSAFQYCSQYIYPYNNL